MKPLFLLVFPLLAPLSAFCQNAKIDSLKHVIETTKVDTVRGRTLCRLCDLQGKDGRLDAAQESGSRGWSWSS